MKIGKLPNEVLEKIVISNINNKRDEVLVKAAVGEDTAIIDFGETLCVVSTDPITGATKNIGGLGVHISCNDVSTSGAEPIGVLMTILAPPGTTAEEIETVMKDAGRVAKEINVEIIGGHTEITDAVNRLIVSTTVIGKQTKENLPKFKDIRVGDKIIITKHAGIEGTTIIANELEDKLLPNIGEKDLNEAKSMGNLISVVKEGMICGDIGVKYMHDITEGGVLGAVWEAAHAIKKGVFIKKDLIPVASVTKKIAEILNIDLYRLISSGSMLMITSSDKSNKIIEELDKISIKATIIGEVTETGTVIEDNGSIYPITPPGSDEIYKALK